MEEACSTSWLVWTGTGEVSCLSTVVILARQPPLPVGGVVAFSIKDKSAAIKDRVLSVLLLARNKDEVGCHDEDKNEDDEYGCPSWVLIPQDHWCYELSSYNHVSYGSHPISDKPST